MSQLRPMIIGLTGGIGSGKTTVCQMFAKRGVEIIDADQIGRTLVAPGSIALQQLIDLLGQDLLTADGSLQRQRLRQLIFSDPHARHQAEAILHPLIRAAILEKINESASSWLILAAPLLLESKSYDFADRILVVDTDETLQIERTRERDHCSEDEVHRIMQIQLPRTERVARATDLIHNNGDLANLDRQVAEYFERYEKLAHARQYTTPGL